MSDPSETSADGVFLPDDRPAEQPAPPDRAVESPIRTQKPHGKPPRVRRVFRWLPVILFLATCLTTCWAGFLTLPSQLTRVDPGTGKTIRFVYRDSATGMTYPVIDQRQSILNGLYYALAVMTTLAAHEAGHYLAARYHRVPATLPMFIPMPIGPIGTMGAVIFQESGIANRRALFDIAIAG
ncbi:MAG: site-2 protease family protein, partial [Planctomycetes bacterium]|nr:site-2 protease family protein [Planctomycetota bacterium]